MKAITLLVLSFACWIHVNATTWYVNINAVGNNNGTSWANAFTGLNSAILAAASGDDIWVAAGTYKPTLTTNRYLSFNLKEGVDIYGGFAGGETLLSQRNYNTNLTILSGEIANPGPLDNTYHVVQAGIGIITQTRLDGFVIRDGYINSTINDGAGLLSVYANLLVENCTFRKNFSGRDGGAISAKGDLVIKNCLLDSNKASNNGGAIHLTDATFSALHCIFSHNEAAFGAGIYTTQGNYTIDSSSCISNQATHFGGGIFADDSSTLTIHCTNVVDNASAYDGGGVCMENSILDFYEVLILSNTSMVGGGCQFVLNGSVNMNRCVIADNSATQMGGFLVSSPSIGINLYNCLIVGNASYNTSSIFSYAYNILAPAPVNFINCTIAHNYQSSLTNPPIQMLTGSSIKNCIIWGNNASALQVNNLPVVYNSVVDGGFPGGVNIDINNPQFIHPANAAAQFDTTGLNYGTGQLSPARNGGDNNFTGLIGQADLPGNTRIQNLIVDMGAYELSDCEDNFIVQIVINNGILEVPDNFAAYQWYYNNQPVPGADSSQLIPLGDGAYHVEVTDVNGCTGISVHFVLLSNKDFDEEGSLRIFPSILKAGETLFIDHEGTFHSTDCVLQLCDMNGKTIFEQSSPQIPHQLDMNDISAGTYVLSIAAGQYRQSFRIIVTE